MLSSFITYQRVCNKSSTKSGTCGVGTTYPSGSYVFTLVWWWGSWCSFIGSLCHLLDIALSFILLLLYLQSFPTLIFLLLAISQIALYICILTTKNNNIIQGSYGSWNLGKVMGFYFAKQRSLRA